MNKLHFTRERKRDRRRETGGGGGGGVTDRRRRQRPTADGQRERERAEHIVYTLFTKTASGMPDRTQNLLGLVFPLG